MKTTPASAFTLLEMLIVITIIAILAGLLFPVVLGAMEKGRQKQALAETRSIVLAIKAYRNEYGKWPAQIQSATDTIYVTSNYCVIQPLLGSNWNNANPKNITFLPLQGGSNNFDVQGNYLDPWGDPYVICMDENADNVIGNSFAGVYTNRNSGTNNIAISLSAVTDAGAASMGNPTDASTWNKLPWCSWQ